MTRVFYTFKSYRTYGSSIILRTQSTIGKIQILLNDIIRLYFKKNNYISDVLNGYQGKGVINQNKYR